MRSGGGRVRRILRLINEISLGWMFAALIAAIFGFAVLYMVFGAVGVGDIEYTVGTHGPITFWDSLYFSVVSLTSLGFGDIRPLGWSRLLVAFEVIVGLSFFGLMVAKISSVKQDYILRRMYYSDVIDGRLKTSAYELEEAVKLYRVTSNALLSGDLDPELTYTFKADVQETTLFYQIHSVLEELDDLIEFEIKNGDFFGDVSASLLARIYASMQGFLDHTVRITERDVEAACNHVLCGNEPRIEGIADIAEMLAELGQRHSDNPELLEQCERIEKLLTQVRGETLVALAAHTSCDLPRKS